MFGKALEAAAREECVRHKVSGTVRRTMGRSTVLERYTIKNRVLIPRLALD